MIIEKINVRGSINELGVGSEPLILPKRIYKPSSVRNTAASVKADTGKVFTVSVTEENIIIKRIS